jgi:23S rRNA pseudouridine1911/1915/1917 synthase
VTPEESGQRLDQLLAAHLSQISRVKVRELINATAAQVNGRRAKAAYRVHQGDVLLVEIPDAVPEGPVAEPIELDVIYEDARLAVVNKPHGMVVHPSKGHWSGTLTAALAYRFRQLSQVGGATRPGIVHRLDRDTSGVIIIARDDQAHLHLSQQFEQRTIEKEYFAICRGKLDRDRDWIDQRIGPHPYQREKMAIRPGHSASREATTFYEVERRFRGYLALRVFPKTGRTHQIRVHLAHVGCPVLCDPLYSGHRILTQGEIDGKVPDEHVVFDRLALHARRIKFRHPDDERPMEFEAPIPESFVELQARFRPL